MYTHASLSLSSAREKSWRGLLNYRVNVRFKRIIKSIPRERPALDDGVFYPPGEQSYGCVARTTSEGTVLINPWREQARVLFD